MNSAPPHSASIAVFAAAHLELVISAACSVARQSLPTSSVTLVATTGRPSAAASVPPAVEVARHAFLATGHRVVLLTPPPLFRAGWRTPNQELGQWTSVPLSPLSGAMSHAILPDRLLAADSLVLINDVRHSDELRPPLALGIWRQYLHPKQRLLVNLASRRLPIDAEIGALIRPRAIILLPYWSQGTLAVVSSDRIAAELVGLAIHQATRHPFAAAAGPWEDPIVQRATELHLGVRLPADLIIEWRWLEVSDSEREADLARLADVVSSRLGVALARSQTSPAREERY